MYVCIIIDSGCFNHIMILFLVFLHHLCHTQGILLMGDNLFCLSVVASLIKYANKTIDWATVRPPFCRFSCLFRRLIRKIN